jgi:O-antigen/teichoic acid export membrane protein
MKAFVKNLSEHPRYSKAYQWAKLISITGGFQVVIQLISFVSGIMIIRLLDDNQLAYYTLANTMLGTMVVLADGGISAGVMVQGAKVWLDRGRLGSVINTGYDLRKKFGVVSILVVSPILYYLLTKNGASWGMALGIIVSLLPIFFVSLSGNLLEIVSKVHQDIGTLQKIKVYNNLARLVLLSGFIFIFPLAYVAISVSVLPQWWSNRMMRKRAEKFADFNQGEDMQVKKDILGMVKRLLPGDIYFCVSGQITIWIISIYGSAKGVAQAGALGKLAMLLAFITVLFNTLVTPRFARLPNDSNLLRNRYIQIMSGVMVVSFGIVCMSWLFSSQILWVLGHKFVNLDYELVLLMIGGSLSMISGCAFYLFTNRGWAVNPLIGIPIGFLSILVGAILLRAELGTLKGILKLDIFVNSIALMVNFSFGLFKIIRSRKTGDIA